MGIKETGKSNKDGKNNLKKIIIRMKKEKRIIRENNKAKKNMIYDNR